MTETPKQWRVGNKGEWQPFEGDIVAQIKPGLYELQVNKSLFGDSVHLQEMKPETDKLLPLPGSLCEYIVNSIKDFWSSKDKYTSMGMLHKRGILLAGAPGTGKTAVCLLVGSQMGQHGGVALFVSSNTDVTKLAMVLKTIREFHPDLPVINIMEDIDRHAVVATHPDYGESARKIATLLSMMDGELQIPNIVHLATTNFVEKLDARLVNRPGRFDEVIRVKSPCKRTREAYIRNIVPSTTAADTVGALVHHSKGLNFAHVKELAVCAVVYDRDISKTANRLRALAESRGAGFDTGIEDEEE